MIIFHRLNFPYKTAANRNGEELEYVPAAFRNLRIRKQGKKRRKEKKNLEATERFALQKRFVKRQKKRWEKGRERSKVKLLAT